MGESKNEVQIIISYYEKIDDTLSWKYAFSNYKDLENFSRVLYLYFNGLDHLIEKFKISLNSGSKIRFFKVSRLIINHFKKSKNLANNHKLSQLFIDNIEDCEGLDTKTIAKRLSRTDRKREAQTKHKQKMSYSNNYN
ncbi:MAG: hypothetical protein IPN10_12905 [Saprospiraceae bacterium]|nr:hypothetical protein [Saprospiraceae bacterium]